MQGFFNGSEVASKPPKPLTALCGDCGLLDRCNTPKQPPRGLGGKQVLLVGNAPSASSDNGSGPDKAEQLLRKTLARLGLDVEKDCVTTNAVICHTQAPTTTQVDNCGPNLTAVIKDVDPVLIIPMGSSAIRAVVGPAWNRPDPGGVGTWAGYLVPHLGEDRWLAPTYDAAYVAKEDNPVVTLHWEQHLAAAIDALHQGRPSGSIAPRDYKAEVECITDPDKAAHYLDKMVQRGGVVAFDYEANMLKPDGPDAQIVSCSVCWRGKKTIAYPWRGAAVEATGRLLRSPLPKVASNMKFEDRWTRKFFGHRVRGWWWDTMLAAHALDYRPGVASIKFQAFARLGVPSYDDHIHQFLKSKGDQRVNRILKEISLPDLLLYNGLDSLLEYVVAIEQAKEVGVAIPV